MTTDITEGEGVTVEAATTERLYTLDQATQVLKEKVCTEQGHQFGVGLNAANNPVSLTCGVCGHHGAIVEWTGTTQEA